MPASQTPKQQGIVSYHCRACNLDFQHHEEETGAYQFMNCPNTDYDDGARLVICRRLEDLCPELHAIPLKSKTRSSESPLAQTAASSDDKDHGPPGKILL